MASFTNLGSIFPFLEVSCLIIPMIQIRKTRLRELKPLAKRHGGVSNLGLSVPKPRFPVCSRWRELHLDFSFSGTKFIISSYKVDELV